MEPESIRAHAEIDARVTSLETAHRDHVSSTDQKLSRIVEQLDALVKYRVQVRAILGAGIGLVLFLGAAGIFGGAKWILRAAVQEELVSQGLVQIRRAAP